MPVISMPRTRLEPISMRNRRMRSGMIGLARRASSARKAPSSASDAPPTPSVRADMQAVFARLDDRESAQHRGQRDQDRAEPVHAAGETDALVLLDQRRAEQERDNADRDVHEEDPVPSNN